MWKLLSLCVSVVAIEGYQTSSDHVDHELLATGSVIYTVDKRLEKLKKDLERAPKFSLEDAYAKVAQKIEDLEGRVADSIDLNEEIKEFNLFIY